MENADFHVNVAVFHGGFHDIRFGQATEDKR